MLNRFGFTNWDWDALRAKAARLLLRVDRTMQLRLLLLGALLLILALPLPMHGDDSDCSGAPPIRLAVGVTARVALQGGAGAIVREYPGSRFKRLTRLADGTIVNITGGPTCTESMQWWRIRRPDGLDGWIAEGDSTVYQLEPWPVVLDVPRQTGDSIQMTRLKADDVQNTRVLATLPLKPISGSVPAVFPPEEWQPLNALLQDDLTRCPTIFQEAEPDFANLQTLDDLGADTGAMDVYPSTDESALLVVRHLWRSLVDCAAKPSSVYGFDRLSLINVSGEKTLLQMSTHAPAPIHLDKFKAAEPGVIPDSRIVGAWWSPDNQRVLLSLQYRDMSDLAVPTYVFRVAVYDLASGAMIDLGDGIRPAWTLSGDRVQWFRLVQPAQSLPPQTLLYSANPDGSDLRGIPLPEGVEFIPDNIFAEPLSPWDSTGTRVMGCVQQDDSGCTTIATFDLTERQLSSPIQISGTLRKIKWLSESRLMWLTGDAPDTLYTQAIQGGTATAIDLGGDGGPITDLVPFADGRTVLAIVGNEDYIIVDTKTGTVTRLKQS